MEVSLWVLVDRSEAVLDFMRVRVMGLQEQVSHARAAGARDPRAEDLLMAWATCLLDHEQRHSEARALALRLEGPRAA